jgi:hypothetical protein
MFFELDGEPAEYPLKKDVTLFKTVTVGMTVGVAC